MDDNARGQSLPELASVKVIGVNAAVVGDAAHDTVLRFAGVPTFNGAHAAGYYLIVTDAVNGTVIRMVRPGKYLIEAEIVLVGQAGAAFVIAGLTLDTAAGNLALNPDWVDSAALDVALSGKAAADTSFHTIKLSAVVEITQAMVNAGTGLLRVQASDGANASPGAQVVIDRTGFRITRIADERD